MQISEPQLDSVVLKDPSLKLGCVVDTNFLFAATYPADQYNEWAEKVLLGLIKNSIPRFTNINIRSEFLDLSRRALIPEGLMDFHDDYKGRLGAEIEQKLKSLRTRIGKATDRAFKFNDIEIKQWRNLLDTFTHPSGKNGWAVFCDAYLEPYFKDVWEDAVKAMGVRSLGNSSFKDPAYFVKEPSWEDAHEIIGKTGVGSSDAMIANFFLSSKFSLLVSTDSDAVSLFARMGVMSRYLLTP